MKKLVVLLLVALTLVGCGSTQKPKELEPLRIGGTALPHADYLNQLKAPLEKLGYKLEVVVFDDYVLPNKALQDKNLDANYFQHIPYLTSFNQDHKTDLAPLLKVHYEPIALYGGTKTKLEDVAAGDVVLVPDDPTNLPRGLKLLEEFGWIELNANRDTATLKDIVKYNVAIEIKPAAAHNIPKLLGSSTYSVINSNYALASKVTDKGIKAETVNAETIEKIVNVVAVRKGEEGSDKSKAILKAFEDPAVVEYIAKTYSPAAISVLGK